MVFPVSSLRTSSSESSSLPSVSKARAASVQAKKPIRGNTPPSSISSQITSASSSSSANSGYVSARLIAARNAASRRPAVPQQSSADKGKLTVVLDLDECLIHSRLSSDQESFRQEEDRKANSQACDEFVFQLDDGEIVRVNKRPGLDKFLESIYRDYEVMVYTAGIENYAGPLLDILDPQNRFFRARLYRDSCVYANGIYTKDLAMFGRPMNRIVLVDNNAMCFLPQLNNGIPISAFYDDVSDTALTVLQSFLERIKNEQDVRPFLTKSFNLETLLREHREQILG